MSSRWRTADGAMARRAARIGPWRRPVGAMSGVRRRAAAAGGRRRRRACARRRRQRRPIACAPSAALQAALPAAEVRFRAGARRSDRHRPPARRSASSGAGVERGHSAGATVATPYSKSSIRVAAAAELRPILETVAAMLATRAAGARRRRAGRRRSLVSRLHRLTIDSLPVGLYVSIATIASCSGIASAKPAPRGCGAATCSASGSSTCCVASRPSVLQAEFDRGVRQRRSAGRANRKCTSATTSASTGRRACRCASTGRGVARHHDRRGRHRNRAPSSAPCTRRRNSRPSASSRPA